MDIEKYLEEWQKSESPKEQNNPKFIRGFTNYIKSKDADHWDFSGENGYCGYTATVLDCFNGYSWSSLDSEFAYGKDFIKVFTAHHHGFWSPEYINLSGEEAKEILDILHQKLIAWGGF